MAGYPPPPGSGYPYGGQPPPQYGAPNPYAPPAQPYGSAPPYGAPPSSAPYGAPPSSAPYGAPPSSAPYGGPKPPKDPYGANSPSAPYGEKPPKENKPGGGGAGVGAYGYPGGQQMPYGVNPFQMLTPSVFPPGTDPTVVACFQAADRDGSGFIDDKELQSALSSYNQTFSMRTVHLLMYLFTGTNVRKIGPKEFSSVFYSLQSWRGIFERFDRDRSGRIDSTELRDALLSLGFSVSPIVLELLISKFDKSGGHMKAVEYDNFIECCLTVKGLTDKFKEKDVMCSGTANFTYDSFMLTVLPFLIA